MRWLTEDSILICDHGGHVSIVAKQDWVRINRRRVLLEPHPEHRPIAACPNSNPLAGIMACMHTDTARKGYSAFVRVGGAPVCLDSLLGYTDGMPPRLANYRVVDPKQALVSADL